VYKLQNTINNPHVTLKELKPGAAYQPQQARDELQGLATIYAIHKAHV